MRCWRHLVVVLGLLAAACVLSSESRPPSSQTNHGPPPPPRDETTAGQLLAPVKGDPSAERSDAASSGYWHWNGVEYVWVPGRDRAADAGYVWR